MTAHYYPSAPPDNTDMSEFTYRELMHVRDEFNVIDERVTENEVNIGVGFTALFDWYSYELWVKAEHVIIRGATSFSSNVLINYTSGYKGTSGPDALYPQLIDYNLSAGTITIGYDGAYRISGYLTQPASDITQNNPYEVAISSPIGDLYFGLTVGTNQALGEVYYSSVIANFSAGDILTITSATISTASRSDFEVALISPGAVAAVPVITLQPVAFASIDENTTLNLSADASGEPVPTWQWYSSISGAIAGATSKDLAYTNVPISEDGANIYAIATNSEGSDQTANCSLTVNVVSTVTPPVWGTVVLPTVTVGGSWNVDLNLVLANNDTLENTTFSYIGTLPSGVTLDDDPSSPTNGVLSGTTDTVQSGSVEFRAENSAGFNASNSNNVSWVVNSAVVTNLFSADHADWIFGAGWNDDGSSSGTGSGTNVPTNSNLYQDAPVIVQGDLYRITAYFPTTNGGFFAFKVGGTQGPSETLPVGGTDVMLSRDITAGAFALTGITARFGATTCSVQLSEGSPSATNPRMSLEKL